MIPGFFRGLFPVMIGGIITGQFIIDRRRFYRESDRIARGIYFARQGRKAIGRSHVISNAFKLISGPKHHDINLLIASWRQESDHLLSRLPIFGANPSVFYYQLLDDAVKGLSIVRLVFYECAIIDVILEVSDS
jgi:hypothetical protein